MLLSSDLACTAHTDELWLEHLFIVWWNYRKLFSIFVVVFLKRVISIHKHMKTKMCRNVKIYIKYMIFIQWFVDPFVHVKHVKSGEKTLFSSDNRINVLVDLILALTVGRIQTELWVRLFMCRLFYCSYQNRHNHFRGKDERLNNSYSSVSSSRWLVMWSVMWLTSSMNLFYKKAKKAFREQKKLLVTFWKLFPGSIKLFKVTALKCGDFKIRT